MVILMIKIEAGKRIRAARENIGMSQTELAELLGYKSRSSINKIELGYVDMPIDKVEKAASVLGVSVRYILGFKENDGANGLPEEYYELTEDQRSLIDQMIRSLVNKSKP